jgi:AraC-like DNA-binding protein
MAESIGILTIFLSLIMVRYNWERNKAIVFFAGALMINSLFIISNKIVVFGTSEILIALFFANFTPLYFLPGPLLYFYFRAITQDSIRFTYWDVLHFIPFVVSFIGGIPYLFSPWSHKLEIARLIIQDVQGFVGLKLNVLVPVAWHNYLRPVLYFCYALASLVLIVRLDIPSDDSNPLKRSQYRSTKQWSYIVLSSILISSIIYTVAVNLFLDVESSAFKTYGPHLLQISAIIYTLIPASLMIYPNVVYGFVRIMDDIQIDSINPKGTEEAATPIKERTTDHTISPEKDHELKALKKVILRYFDEEAPFINPEFKLLHIASHLNIPAHHVSYCFTNAFEESFTQLRTRYRVQYATRLLEQGAADQYSIEGVGKLSGFVSKSNFFTSFKEIMGLTPQQYIHKLGTIEK